MKSLLTGALVGLVLSCAVVRANEDRPARRSSLSYCVHLLVSQVLPPKRDDAEALARELTAAGLNDYVFPYLSGVIYPRSPWPDTEDAIIWMSGLSTEGLPNRRLRNSSGKCASASTISKGIDLRGKCGSCANSAGPKSRSSITPISRTRIPTPAPSR